MRLTEAGEITRKRTLRSHLPIQEAQGQRLKTVGGPSLYIKDYKGTGARASGMKRDALMARKYKGGILPGHATCGHIWDRC